jgi:hypothetical protein
MARRKDRVRGAAKGRHEKIPLLPLPMAIFPEAYDCRSHPCATTTAHMRKTFQDSELSTRKLAAQYRRNPKTVSKWRNRDTVIDEPMGPKRPHSYCLDKTEEDFVKHYRLVTGFGLRECLMRLRDIFPKLTRPSLYRCFKRHDVNRLPRSKRTTIEKETAKFPAGEFCMTVQPCCDEAAFFAAIENGSGRVYSRRLQYSVEGAIEFLKQLIEDVPDDVKGISVPYHERLFWCKIPERHEGPFANYRQPFFAFCQQLKLPVRFHNLDEPGSVTV